MRANGLLIPKKIIKCTHCKGTGYLGGSKNHEEYWDDCMHCLGVGFSMSDPPDKLKAPRS